MGPPLMAVVAHLPLAIDPPRAAVVPGVEAMPSKVILMMPKNQELSKFQR